MTEWSAEEPYQSLAEHRLGRSGLILKLDRGFEQGVYGICIDYAPLAERVGFTAARRQALDYAVRLHGQLARVEEYTIDDIEDDSRTGMTTPSRSASTSPCCGPIKSAISIRQASMSKGETIVASVSGNGWRPCWQAMPTGRWMVR